MVRKQACQHASSPLKGNTMAENIFVTARVWGKFQWPPVPKQTKYKDVTGVVQVEYVKQRDGKYNSRVVWIPGSEARRQLNLEGSDRDDLRLETDKTDAATIQNISDFSKSGFENKILEIDAGKIAGFAFVGGTFFEVFERKKNDEYVVRLPIAEDGRANVEPVLSRKNSELQLMVQLPCVTSGEKLKNWDRPTFTATYAYQVLHRKDPGYTGPSYTKAYKLRVREHFTGIMKLLGEEIPSSMQGELPPQKLSFDLSKSTIRYRLEHLPASWLKGLNGVLRAKAAPGDATLQIAFGRQSAFTLDTESTTFGLSITATWEIKRSHLLNCLNDSSEKEKKIEANVFPEVYWTNRAQKPDSDKDQEGLGILWEAFAQSLFARDFLKTTNGGSATSFLPSRTSDLPEECELALVYRAVTFGYLPRAQISDSLEEQTSPQCISFLSDIKPTFSVPKTFSKEVQVNFENSLGEQKTVTLVVCHLQPKSLFINDGASRAIMCFKLKQKEAVDATNPSSSYKSVVGGLEFSHTDNFLIDNEDRGGQVIIGLPVDETGLVSHGVGKVPRLSVYWEFYLNVTRVRSNRIDVPWGEREVRQFPLVIPLLQETGQSNFVLHVRESISPRQDRHLVCNLIEKHTDNANTADSYLLLSRDPWSVVKFNRRRFSLSGDQDDAIIATFDSDNRVWRYKMLAPEYRFQFPPQVIGESADKPRRLELHDINAIDPDGKILRESDVVSDGGKLQFIRPVPIGNGTRKSYVVENALTPSLDLWIKPSDLARKYVMAEWNAYELFRQRNDFGIGVALRALCGEFLYGLMVAIETASEKSQNSLARVSEIEAIMGILPQRSYKTIGSNSDEAISKVEEKLGERWLAVRDALLSRQERLEIWTPAYDQARPFVPARFESGVKFALRSTALFRSPTGDEGLELTAPESLRVSTDQGLSGGALWPIEFQSFWKALQERPQSVGGSIENIAIGPTGGDAIQSARFLDGLVTIASETRAGFVHRQRVEILGRIGAFWNRAKHVVIYERTVNPSEQFAPEPVDGDQEKWRFSRSRRAVLRKVTEYIEILEPTRCYPDEPTGTPKQTGFLDSLRFETKIIFVDSAWGRDVKQNEGKVEGYEIPLWNLRASKMRPNVYRMPGVVFVTVGEGREERPLVPRQCANPDNLYFYAQASPREGDTNKWAPVFTVDYANLIDATYCEQNAVMGGNGYGSFTLDGIPHGRKPSPPRVLPGHHRFTWRLLPSSEKTLLNAEYGSKPVYGGLETITFSRGAPFKPEGVLKKHIEIDAKAISQLSEVKDFMQRNLADIRALRIADDTKELTKGQKNELARIQAEVAAITKVWTEATDSIKQTKARSIEVLRELGIENTPDVNAVCKSLKQEIAEIANRKRMLMAEALGGWQEELESFVERVISPEKIKKAFEDLITEKSAVRTKIAKAIAILFQPFAPLNEVLGNFQNKAEHLKGDIENAQRILSDAVADVDSVLLSAENRISAIFESAEQTLDWSVERYDRFRSQFNSEVAGLQTELSSAEVEICMRAGGELSPLLPDLSKNLVDKTRNLIDSISESLRHENLTLPVEIPGSGETKKIVETTKTSLIDAIRYVRSEFERDAQQALSTLGQGKTQFLDGAIAPLNSFASEVLRTQFLGRSLVQLIDQNVFGQIEADINKYQIIGDETARKIKEQIKSHIKDIGSTIREKIPQEVILDGFAEKIADACENFKELAKQQAEKYFPGFDNAKENLDKVKDFYNVLSNAKDDVKQLKESIEKIGGEGAKALDSLSGMASAGQAYSNRVMEGFAKAGSGGIGAAPSNVLKIISAATASPELGQMQANADRMRCAYEETKLATTKLRATFGKLGDALKALGIDVPFEGLTDELTLPEDVLKKYDISQLFPNFGGLDLKGLLPDVKVPEGVKDTVKLSHDFDKKQFRAWVQIDVNMPVKGKKELFAIGPFALSFRETLLTSLLRAEASKDNEQVSTTAKSEIATIIDVEISGERMLSLEDVTIRYNKESGIDFRFDPKKIKLQQSLQFVQDTLGEIFGDEIGGMKLIKQNGIPVGVSHEYSIPNISFMAGTSGVSNIQISNSFKLLAYPDFVISNRFNLSKAELPFLFSFFIVGGSGYVYIDASYRPFDQTLIVEVEASAGGSASLGFSVGPVKGSVFISFSLVITYRKTLSGGSATGDGLAVSTQLVIAGNVSLYGMVDVYLGILLRMQYGEGGKIDGKGRIDLKVKISRFITLKYSSEVTLKLRNGRAETTRVTDSSVNPGARIQEQAERLKKLKDQADQLQGARA